MKNDKLTEILKSMPHSLRYAYCNSAIVNIGVLNASMMGYDYTRTLEYLVLTLNNALEIAHHKDGPDQQPESADAMPSRKNDETFNADASGS